MKINIKKEPLFIFEYSLLGIKGLNYDGVREENLYKSFNLDRSKEDSLEDMEEFFDLRNLMLKEVSREVDKFKILKEYTGLKNSQIYFLPTIVRISSVEKIEDFTYEKFIKSSLRSLIVINIEDDRELLNKNIDKILEAGIDFNNIMKILNDIKSKDIIDEEDFFLYIKFFNKLEEIYPAYINLLKSSKIVYDKYYPSFNKFLEKYLENKKIRGKFISESEDLYISKLVNLDSFEEVKNIEILDYYPSIINYRELAVTAFIIDGVKVFATEGVLFKRLYTLKKENKKDIESIKEELLALGDETRFSIIKLLREKPFYLKELSDNLYLAPSTVSYHMQILLNSGLVKVFNEGRKIYYELNKDSFRKTGNNLLEMAGGEDDR